MEILPVKATHALTGRIFLSFYTSCLFLAGDPGGRQGPGPPESIRGSRGGSRVPAQGRKITPGREERSFRCGGPSRGQGEGNTGLPERSVGRGLPPEPPRGPARAGEAGFPLPPPLSPSLPSPFSRLGIPLLAPCKSRGQRPGIKILPVKATHALTGRIFSINLYCLFILARRIWRETGPSARRKACGEAVPIQWRKSIPTGEGGLPPQ